MNKKRLSAIVVALVLILSCGFTAFALAPLSIGQLISILSSVDTSNYNEYTQQSWYSMSSSERLNQINYVISSQGGSSYISETSDFINNDDLSYNYYSLLIGSSPMSGCLLSGDYGGNIMAKQYLEKYGLADFGLGFYSGNGHSSGKFGEGTVADTLNNDFLDYIQKVPYSSNSSSPRYQFANGYSIDYEPVYWSEGAAITFNGAKHYSEYYRLRFYLYNSDGVMIDTQYGSDTILDRVCITCGIQPYSNVVICEDGRYYYYVSSDPIDHKFHDCETRYFTLPWYSDYGLPVEVSTDPNAVGVDDDGNTIDLNINSNGVTYEGNTYNYNDDNSVTINGNTYYISVDPNSVDDDYYHQFINNTVNNYYNYYTTESTPFDGTDILTSLKSIFTSLDTFRSNCFTQIKQIYDSVFDGFNSMRSSLSSILKKLDTIINQLKEINKNLDELSEEQKKENELGWHSLISKFQDKVGWSTLSKSMTNISVAFFGSREYETSDAGEISVFIVSDDTRIASSMPSLSIDFMGVSYNLYSCVGYLGSGIETIKGFIRVFLWVGFIVSVFRSLPSIIGGVSSVQDHSNNVVVDRHTGEVKWGA